MQQNSSGNPAIGRQRPAWLVCSALAVAITCLTLTTAMASAPPDSLRLSLAQAMEVAREHHLGLRSARLSTQMQEQAVAQEAARFGRTLTANLTQQNSRSPSSSKLEQVPTSTSGSQSLGLSLSQQLTSGGTVGIDFRNNRSSSNAAYQVLNPQYQSGLTLRWSQPLLQGRGSVNRIGLQVVSNSLNASRISVESQSRELDSQVGQAYWALVLARQGLSLRQQLLAGAERVLESVQARAEVGAGARSAILEAQVTVAQRQQEIVSAQGSLRQAEDQLRSLLGIDQEPGGWEVGLLPTQAPELLDFAGEPEAGVVRALDRDASYQQAALAVQSAALQLTLARDQARPSLSLTAQAAINGIGGSYGDNLDALKQGEARNWQGGLGLSMPLGSNPQAVARVRQQEYAVQQRQVQAEQIRLQLAAQVRTQHRQVGISRQAEQAAAWTEQRAEQNVAEQEERLGLGLSTVRQVLDAQDALAQARLTRLQAVVTYNDALLEWKRLTGE